MTLCGIGKGGKALTNSSPVGKGGKEIFFVIVLATGKGGYSASAIRTLSHKPAALTFNPMRIEGTAALIE